MNSKDKANLQEIQNLYTENNDTYQETLKLFHEVSETYGNNDDLVKELGIKLLRESDKTSMLESVLNILEKN